MPSAVLENYCKWAFQAAFITDSKATPEPGLCISILVGNHSDNRMGGLVQRRPEKTLQAPEPTRIHSKRWFPINYTRARYSNLSPPNLSAWHVRKLSAFAAFSLLSMLRLQQMLSDPPILCSIIPRRIFQPVGHALILPNPYVLP